MKSKATSSSIGNEVESRINRAYSTILAIWKRSVELQVDLSERLHSTKTVSAKFVDQVASEFRTMLSKLREDYLRIDPLLTLADQRYTIFFELENRIEHYLNSLKFLPKGRDDFLGATGHKTTRYIFMELAYTPACRKFVLVDGEKMLLLSPLANLLQEYLENVEATFSEEQVEYLIRERVSRERDYLLQRFPRVVPPVLSTEQATPKRGRRPKADLKSRDNRELLIAILKQHHRYESSESLRTDPISTEEACRSIGKSESTLSKTWREIRPGLTYAGYRLICGQYDSLRRFLKAIDSKEGYLERSNKEGVLDNSEE